MHTHAHAVQICMHVYMNMCTNIWYVKREVYVCSGLLGHTPSSTRMVNSVLAEVSDVAGLEAKLIRSQNLWPVWHNSVCRISTCMEIVICDWNSDSHWLWTYGRIQCNSRRFTEEKMHHGISCESCHCMSSFLETRCSTQVNLEGKTCAVGCKALALPLLLLFFLLSLVSLLLSLLLLVSWSWLFLLQLFFEYCCYSYCYIAIVTVCCLLLLLQPLVAPIHPRLGVLGAFVRWGPPSRVRLTRWSLLPCCRSR